jgi:hypothetical protein
MSICQIHPAACVRMFNDVCSFCGTPESNILCIWHHYNTVSMPQSHVVTLPNWEVVPVFPQHHLGAEVNLMKFGVSCCY